MGTAKKKRLTMLSFAPASVFASLEIFGNALAFVSASPLAFFSFALVFFCFAPAYLVPVL